MSKKPKFTVFSDYFLSELSSDEERTFNSWMIHWNSFSYKHFANEWINSCTYRVPKYFVITYVPTLIWYDVRADANYFSSTESSCEISWKSFVGMTSQNWSSSWSSRYGYRFPKCKTEAKILQTKSYDPWSFKNARDSLTF